MLGGMSFRSRTSLAGSSSTPSRAKSSQSQAPNNDKVFNDLKDAINSSNAKILKSTSKSHKAELAYKVAKYVLKETAGALIEIPGAKKVVNDVIDKVCEDFSDPANIMNQESEKAQAGFKSSPTNEAKKIFLTALAAQLPDMNDTDYDDPYKTMKEFILPSQGNLNQKCGKYIQSVLENISNHKGLTRNEQTQLKGIVEDFANNYEAKIEKKMDQRAPLMGTKSNSSARTPDQIREDEFYKSALQIKDPYGDVTNPMWGG
jgi:hypothetical protein